MAEYVNVTVSRDTWLVFIGWVQAKRQPGGADPAFVDEVINSILEAIRLA